MVNSTNGTYSGQPSHHSPPKERRTSATTPLTRSTLLVVLWWCGEPKLSDAPSARPQRLVQTRPEGDREARVAVLYEHVGQPHVAEHRRSEVACRSLSRGGLRGRDSDKPDPARQQVDVHLHKVVA